MSGGDPPFPPSRPHSWHSRPSHRRRGGPPGNARNGWVTRRPRSPPLFPPRPRPSRPQYKHHRHIPPSAPNPSQNHSAVYHSHGPPPLSRNLQGRLRSPPRSPLRHSDLPVHRIDPQPYRGEPGPSHRVEPLPDYSFRGPDPPSFRTPFPKSRGESFSLSSERPSLRGPPDHPPPYRGEPGPLYRADSVPHRDDFEARRGMGGMGGMGSMGGGGGGVDGMSHRTDSSQASMPWFRPSGKIHKTSKPKKRRFPPHAVGTLRASGPFMSKPQSPILSRIGLPFVDRHASGPRIPMGFMPGAARRAPGPSISPPKLSQEFSLPNNRSNVNEPYGFGPAKPSKSISPPRQHQQTPRSVPDERTNNDRQQVQPNGPAPMRPEKQEANLPNGTEKRPRAAPENSSKEVKPVQSEPKRKNTAECNGTDWSHANGPTEAYSEPASDEKPKQSPPAPQNAPSSRRSDAVKLEKTNWPMPNATSKSDAKAYSSDIEDVQQSEKESGVAHEARSPGPVRTAPTKAHIPDTDNVERKPHVFRASNHSNGENSKNLAEPGALIKMELCAPGSRSVGPLSTAESKQVSEHESKPKKGERTDYVSTGPQKQHSLLVPSLSIPEAPVPVPAPAMSLLRSAPRSRTRSSSFEGILGSLSGFRQYSATTSPTPVTTVFLRGPPTKTPVASADLVKQIHDVDGKITLIERTLAELRNNASKKSDQAAKSEHEIKEGIEQESDSERYAALAQKVLDQEVISSNSSKRSKHPLHVSARLLLVQNQAVAAASHAEMRTICSDLEMGLDGVVEDSAFVQEEVPAAIRAKMTEYLKKERAADLERRRALAKEYKNSFVSWREGLAAAQENMSKSLRDCMRERDREMLLSTKGTSALLTSRTSSGRTSTKIVPSVGFNGQTKGTAELDQMLADIEAEGGTPGARLIWSKTLAEVPDQNPTKVPPDCLSVLMIDPVAEHHASRAVNPWRFEEVLVFLDKYLTCSKNFIKIASFLEHKSPRDCSYFYYLNKLRLGLKQLTKDASAMKRRGTLRRHLIQVAKRFVFLHPEDSASKSFYVSVQNAVAVRASGKFIHSDDMRGTSFLGVVSNRQGYTVDRRHFPMKRSEKILQDAKAIDLTGIERKAFSQAMAVHGTDWKSIAAQLGVTRKSSTHYREFYRRNKRRLDADETREHSRNRLLLPSRNLNLGPRDSPRMSPRSSPRHSNHGSRSKITDLETDFHDPMQLDDTDNDEVATRIMLKDCNDSEHKANEEVSRPRHDGEKSSRATRRSEKDGKKGKATATWTTEECVQFRVLFKQHGRDWKSIARLMAPKTPTQIKGYWRTVSHEVGDGLMNDGTRSRSQRRRMKRRSSTEALNRQSQNGSQSDLHASPKAKAPSEREYEETLAEENNADLGVNSHQSNHVDEGESSGKKGLDSVVPKEPPSSAKSDSGQHDGTSTEIANSEEKSDLNKGRLPLLRSLPMPVLRSVPITPKQSSSETAKDNQEAAVPSSVEGRNENTENEGRLRKAAESYGVLEHLGDKLHDSEEGTTKSKHGLCSAREPQKCQTVQHDSAVNEVTVLRQLDEGLKAGSIRPRQRKWCLGTYQNHAERWRELDSESDLVNDTCLVHECEWECPEGSVERPVFQKGRWWSHWTSLTIVQSYAIPFWRELSSPASLLFISLALPFLSADNSMLDRAVDKDSFNFSNTVACFLLTQEPFTTLTTRRFERSQRSCCYPFSRTYPKSARLKMVSEFALEGRLVVAACRSNRGIGKDGQLPWPRLSQDLKHFKQLTTGSPVVMGSVTYNSLPKNVRPLPGRLNIVISSKNREELGCPDSVLVAGSLDAAAEMLRSRRLSTVYVIGGASIYEEALKKAEWSQRIFLTDILTDFPADRFFPIDMLAESSEFDLVSLSATHEDNDVKYRMNEYVRRSHSSSISRAPIDHKHEEYQYLELVERIIKTGVCKGDRTGVGTRSIFGAQMRFNLRESFPLLTTKRVFWRGVAEELLWFIRGSTNANELAEKGIRIWDGNGSREFLDSRGFTDREVGDLGPVYGFQWRHFGAEYTNMHDDYTAKGVDQLAQVIETIKRNPNDRRMLMCAWNPSATDKMALPPCHLLAQFYVANGELSCQMYQRSCDMGLGVPFNIASYSLLTCLVASVTGLKPGEFVHVLGDAHVYNNHVEALQEQVKRTPNAFPRLKIKPCERIEDFVFEDLTLEGYEPQKAIAMKMAV